MGVTYALDRHGKEVRRYSCAVLWPNAVTSAVQPPIEVQITDSTHDGIFDPRKVGEEIEVS